MVQQMSYQGTECICTSRVGKAVSKTAEEKLLDAVYIGFGFANEGLKNASFQVVKQILMEVAHSCEIDKVFDRNTER